MAQQFLVELSSKDSQSLLQKLDFLLDHLENKEDPEPFEMHIVDVGYQALDRLKTLESILRKHAAESNLLTGDKLQNLYDKKPIDVGSQVMFSD
jgi:hypothetical protein